MSESKAECLWQGQRYSEGSETCQNGALKECVNGSWVNRGSCQSPDNSQDFIKTILSQYPPLTKAEEEAHSKEPWSKGEVRPNIYEAYAEVYSIRDGGNYTYFRGGSTVGQACLKLQNYQIISRDIISIGAESECGPGNSWVKLFTWRA